MENDKKPVQLIRNELKYLIFITLFVAGIIFNYTTISDRIKVVDNKSDINAYQIGEIKTAREKAWARYDSNCERQMEQLEKINRDLLKIKVKLGIED